MKFNRGNSIKTTFDDVWEVKRAGTVSLEKAAYVIGLDDSSPPKRTQIIEHFWADHGIRHAQTYLSIEVNQSAAATRSIMQYHFIDPSYQANPITLKSWFNLTFQTYAEYNGVSLNNLHIKVRPEHLVVFLSLLAPEIEQGLQVSAAAAA
ncbi:MAG TPA: hypothetical protein PLY23_08770 [Alphaproteobacteria bacterium]|nr:hypothetical protein [Alphaproteobacteria bacterium]HQS94728.1 hypothetical protein [Alphaproteobacteria bacterium]